VSPAEAFPAAREAALRGLALDSTLGDAYIILGQVAYQFTWDFPLADREFKRGIALNPGAARSHFYYEHFLAAMGRHDEAIAEARMSQVLDPTSVIHSAAAARPYYNARDYAGAIRQSLKTLELDSNFSRALFWLGLSYEQTARLPEAIRALERTVALAPIPLYQAALGHAYAVAGERAKAQRILQSLLDRSRSGYVLWSDIAMLHAGLGEREHTLEALDRAFDAREPYMVFLNVDPRFDPYRNEPRFRDLVRRIGLPVSD
jgi:tetratricopeptide (TPR) repeat protein